VKLGAYDRIAPLYDLLDAPYEFSWRARLRGRMFHGLSGRILDAGVGTGRNIRFYTSGSEMVGIDQSAAMLERARWRADTLGRAVDLRVMDLLRLDFPDGHFDAIVSTFVFCVLEDDHQLPALSEVRRVCRPGGTIRLLDYSLSRHPLGRLVMRSLEQVSRRIFSAHYSPKTEAFLDAAGLELIDRRFVFGDMVKMLELRPVDGAPRRRRATVAVDDPHAEADTAWACPAPAR
jgi:ubiquinone/menaquinone biosynthesis C-methylase UbiE